MSYVIIEKCLGERYASCVEVCPVDCIYPGEYQGEEFMVIDPDICIDCSLCKPACPIDAIVETEEESPEWAEINAQLSPDWKDNEPAPVRPRDDPPRKPGHEIVNP
jgi:ferredoxin